MFGTGIAMLPEAYLFAVFIQGDAARRIEGHVCLARSLSMPAGFLIRQAYSECGYI
jgi:hypothetical protein